MLLLVEEGWLKNRGKSKRSHLWLATWCPLLGNRMDELGVAFSFVSGALLEFLGNLIGITSDS